MGEEEIGADSGESEDAEIQMMDMGAADIQKNVRQPPSHMRKTRILELVNVRTKTKRRSGDDSAGGDRVEGSDILWEPHVGSGQSGPRLDRAPEGVHAGVPFVRNLLEGLMGLLQHDLELRAGDQFRDRLAE